MQFIKYIKYKAQYHGNHTGKNHSGKFYISQIQSDSGKAYNKYNRSQRQIPGFSVIHLIIYQHTKT